MLKSVIKSSLILSAGLLLGRFAGYGREWTLAFRFGATNFSDIIVLLLVVPDFINNLISSGVLNAIYLPEFSKNKKDFRSVANRAYAHNFILSIVLYFVVSLIVTCIYNIDTTKFLLIALLSVVINSFGSVAVVILTHKEKFKLQSIGNLIFNIIFIAFLIFFDELWIYSFGVVVAAITRTYFLIRAAHRYSLSFSFFNILGSIEVKKIKRDFQSIIHSIWAYGLIFLNPLVDKIIGGQLSEGSISLLNYAEKLYLLPVSILITPLAVVSFPKILTKINCPENESVFQYINKIVAMILMLSFSICLVYYFYGQYFVEFLFGYGKIRAQDIISITSILKHYLIAILMTGLISFGMNMLFAVSLTQKCLIISFLSFVLNIVGDLLVLAFDYELKYIATVTSFTSFCVVIFLAHQIFINRAKFKGDKWNI